MEKVDYQYNLLDSYTWVVLFWAASAFVEHIDLDLPVLVCVSRETIGRVNHLSL